MTVDLARSILDRLRNEAQARGEDFQVVLARFGVERMLYRISISPHAEAKCRSRTMPWCWTELVMIEFPPLLGMTRPVLKAYPLETVVAEKLEILTALGTYTSREAILDRANLVAPSLRQVCEELAEWFGAILREHE